MEENQELFWIKSFYTVAYLKTKGLKVEKVDEEDGKILFYFIKDDKLFDALNKYQKDGFLNSFVNNFLEVKSMAYEMKNNRK